MAYERGFISRSLDEFLPQVQLPPLPDNNLFLQPADEPWTLILTGSTGSLGTHILAVLARYPPERIRRVYCLNRSEPCPLKHRFALQDDRFVFLKAAFDTPMLGLQHALYHQLLDEVNLVIHNAWTVNFLLPGEAFRPSLAGLRNFLHFSYQSPLHPPVLFVSSLGIGYAAEVQHIEERVYNDADMASAIGDGYSQSIYVAKPVLSPLEKPEAWGCQTCWLHGTRRCVKWDTDPAKKANPSQHAKLVKSSPQRLGPLSTKGKELS